MATKKGKTARPAGTVECWKIAAVREGIADAEAGNLTDLAQVKAKWTKRAKACSLP